MANVAVINAIDVTPYAFAPLAGGKDAFSRVLDFAGNLPGVERIHLLTDSPKAAEEAARAARKVTLGGDEDGWSVGNLFREFATSGEDFDDLFYFYADCPLLDGGLAARMYDSHRRYFSEYTFADGYPMGMAPEILRIETLPRAQRLIKEDDTRIARDAIFSLLQRDINAFDIETELSPKDLRLLRVQLFCDTRRNYQITSRIIEAGGSDEESVLTVITDRPQLLRSLPAFFEIQVTEAVSQLVSYSPYPKVAPDRLRQGKEMSPEQFEYLTEKIAEFADDAVVSVSLWGEPALHSHITDLAEAVLKRDHLELLIETSGIGWRDEDLEAMKRFPWQRITWIVDLDASTPELYHALRGPGWEEAQQTCSRLIDLFPGRVHVQAVRMQENESDLEGFYRHWKERLGNVIIQKYDWFCGYLPQRKVTDLSPLRRQPCWHLKRDMNILVDGAVPLCREDLEQQHLLGNAFDLKLEEIWANGQSFYTRHVQEDYPELCKGCDEYYTFNF